MRFRLGNPFSTKMTKNNILNKELKSKPMTIVKYDNNEIRLSFEADNIEVELRLSEEEILRIADSIKSREEI